MIIILRIIGQLFPKIKLKWQVTKKVLYITSFTQQTPSHFNFVITFGLYPSININLGKKFKEHSEI